MGLTAPKRLNVKIIIIWPGRLREYHIIYSNRIGPHVHRYHINTTISALPLSRFPDFTPLALDSRRFAAPRGFRDFQPKGTEPCLFPYRQALTIPNSLHRRQAINISMILANHHSQINRDHAITKNISS